jgi:anti-sigma regulatory factor (Ser/Thr protein kinase)
METTAHVVADEARYGPAHTKTRNGGRDAAGSDGTSVPAGRADRTLVDVEMLATPGVVGEVRRLLRGVAAQVGAQREVQDDVAQAVSEAVTNVVVHAYPSARRGVVRVMAAVAGRGLEIVVRDSGRGFVAGHSGGVGVGLSLIAAMTARFRIEQRAPHGTDVWMRFHLPA